MGSKTDYNTDEGNPSQWTDIIGQWGMIPQDAKTVKWFIRVVGQPFAGYFLVQVYAPLSGQPTVQRIFHIRDMVEWNFFDSADDLRDWHKIIRDGHPFV